MKSLDALSLHCTALRQAQWRSVYGVAKSTINSLTTHVQPVNHVKAMFIRVSRVRWMLR